MNLLSDGLEKNLLRKAHIINKIKPHHIKAMSQQPQQLIAKTLNITNTVHLKHLAISSSLRPEILPSSRPETHIQLVSHHISIRPEILPLLRPDIHIQPTFHELLGISTNIVQQISLQANKANRRLASQLTALAYKHSNNNII